MPTLGFSSIRSALIVATCCLGIGIGIVSNEAVEGESTCENLPPAKEILNLSIECGAAVSYDSPSSKLNNIFRRNNRIAGGHDARVGQFPSYVRTRASTMDGTFNCGGTILNERYVLTAAHCANESLTIEKIEIQTGFIGYDDFDKAYQAELVCKPAEHLRVKPDLDMALLRVKEPIEFNNRVQPACLAEADFSDQKGYAVGMGYTSPVPFSRLAFALQVLAVNSVPCHADLKPGIYGTCFGSSQGDLCEGDSGGPVFATIDGRQTVLGIASRGGAVCEADLPGSTVFTDVYKTRELLARMLKECIVD